MKWNFTDKTITRTWRRETWRHFQTIVKQARAAGKDRVTALHDLRVAIRRLRVLLRALDKPLARTTARSMARRWQDFTGELSPLRDADVWQILLHDLPDATPAFRQRLFARFAQTPAPLTDILHGRTWQHLLRDTKTLLEKEIRNALKTPAKLEPERAFFKAWEEATTRAAKLARNRRRLRHPEAAHKLRIACRRARYLAEFLAVAASHDKKQRTWLNIARRYQFAQNALGKTHDTDTLLAFLREQRLRPPAALRDALVLRRTQGLVDFKKCWRKLAAPS